MTPKDPAVDNGKKTLSSHSTSSSVILPHEKTDLPALKGDERIGAAFGETAGKSGGQARRVEGGWGREEGLTIYREISDGGKETAAREGEGTETCTGAGAGDSPGAQWSLNGKGGGEAAVGVAQDVLRVGGEVAQSHGPGVGESSCGKTACACGRREGDASRADPGVGEEAGCREEDHQGERVPGGV